MTIEIRNTPSLPDEYSVLKSILEGTASHTGEHFFQALLRTLSRTLKTKGARITEFDSERNRLRAISFWMDDHFVDEYEYNIAETPCEEVLERRGLFHDNPDLEPFRAVSYLGAPIQSPDGTLLGHLAVQDTRPMPEQAKKGSYSEFLPTVPHQKCEGL